MNSEPVIVGDVAILTTGPGDARLRSGVDGRNHVFVPAQDRGAVAAAILGAGMVAMERGRAERLIEYAAAHLVYEAACGDVDTAALVGAPERYRAALAALQPGDRDPLPEAT